LYAPSPDHSLTLANPHQAAASVLSDVPFNSSNIFLFSIILYFMGGLYSSAGAFFIFYLFVFITFM